MAKSSALKTPADSIKELCPLFAGAGVTSIEIDYDGSGDSGDFSSFVFRFDDPFAQADPTINSSTHKSRMNFDQFKNEYANNNVSGSLITPEQLDAFHESMWELLPGGWEINEGSYGEIRVDVATQRVTMTHNERITDVNTSTQTW